MPRPPLICLTLALLSTAWADSSEKDELPPYETDQYTLHLWHLDEAAPPFHDAGLSSTPLRGLHNGATAKQPAYPGMGHSISFHHSKRGEPGESTLKGGILTEAPSLANGYEDQAPQSLKHHNGGAFTYEALIKLDIKPAEAKVIALGIISMDGEEDDERIFNFRIERQGFLTFTPLGPFGAKGGAIATIPKVGPHALNTTDWFHVAVTYNGKPNTPNNLKLYWTKIALATAEANQIGSGNLARNFPLDPRGDFAIGNEARATPHHGNTESEPFPGCLDEIRISSVARHPSDFLFVPPSLRRPPLEIEAKSAQPPPLKLGLATVMVNGEETSLPTSPEKPLILPAGLHRLDFDLSFSSEQMTKPVKLLTQLDGMDNTWRNVPLGMSLFFDVLDSEGRILSQARSVAIGSSFGWDDRPETSTFTDRSEPLFIPHEATALRITLDSGSADTTGSFIIDDIKILLPGEVYLSDWPNSDFSEGENLTSVAGVPTGWTRGGSDPSIAQVIPTTSAISIGLIDGHQYHSGTWSAVIQLDPTRHSGKTVATRWSEIYNIIPGSMHRASYVNVPAGQYAFRAVWISDHGTVSSGGIEFPIEIKLPVWKRPWFWPLVTAAAIGLLALIIIRETRRINRRKIRQLWVHNTLEQDRSRIARDMHDDLGTRVSVLNINASLVKLEIDRDPEKAQRHLHKLHTSARDLVVAMNDLVWAVDPCHDSLDHLATHLTRLTEDLLGEGPVRYRLDIPANLPDHQLGSDFRHHISLAVKEALNNSLKHAGPCELHLAMSCQDSLLKIEVRDNGCGFASEPLSSRHHGLRNFSSRLEALGGTATITSSLNQGTCIIFSCPITEKPLPIIP